VSRLLAGRRLAACLLLSLILVPSAGSAQYSTVDTKHARIFYRGFAHGFIIDYATRCFENAFAFYEDVYHYTPSEKVNVFLDDWADYNNAGAWTAPRNGISVMISPTNRVYETAPSNERINHSLNHEMMHIVALDQAAGWDRFFRTLFAGKVRATPEHPETILYELLTSPRRAAPRWYHEGIAVFMETWMAAGLGRAQGPYDEMVFRSMVKDKSPFYDPLGIESEGTQVDFQAGVNSYLYGTRFISYLGLIYGPEKLVEWTGRGPGSKGSFAAQFKKVFGMSLDDGWADWVRWEHAFQEKNLAAIREYPVTPFRDISRRALGSVSRAYYDPGSKRLYAGLNYPGIVGHLAAIDTETGEVERLIDIPGPALYFVTSLACDGSRTLFYTANNGDWRDLHAYDLETGEDRRLMNDVRIGDLAYCGADSMLWGIRHFNGVSTLVRMPPPYTEWQQVFSPPYGTVMYDIDVSPDGTLLSFSLSEVSGRQTLCLAETDKLLDGDASSYELYDFGSSLPGNFVFSPDGNYLYGSSYVTGASNIWRWSFAADSMEVVSNCETGFFRPIPLGGGSLIAFRYTGEGFVPGYMEAEPLQDVNPITFLGNEIVEAHPVVKDWNAGSPQDVDLDPLVERVGPYRPLGSIGVTSVYPVVEGYRHITSDGEPADYAAAGLHMDLADPGFDYKLGLTASYTPDGGLPDDERLHAHLGLEKGKWTVDLGHNEADFYDLFGPTRTSRRANYARIGYSTDLFYDPPRSLRLRVSTAGYNNLIRLPDAQNVSASFDELWTTSASLSYMHLKASLGATDFEKGLAWNLRLTNNYVNKRTFPKLLGTFDVGTPLLPHSSVWLRTAAGIAPGDREEPFANFFFGGFGNNWVDHGRIKRYREYDSFAGLDLDKLHGALGQIGGTNFAKVIVDVNLPPVRFRRVGRPSFYLTWARFSVFTSGLATNIDDPESFPRSLVANVGGQSDIRFTLLNHLNMTLSLGYAFSFDQHAKPDNEFMASLKVL
jgi:hypothetical protein